MEKKQLKEERKKLEQEKAKFLEMTNSYRDEEEKQYMEDQADSGIGSRNDTAEVSFSIVEVREILQPSD